MSKELFMCTLCCKNASLILAGMDDAVALTLRPSRCFVLLIAGILRLWWPPVMSWTLSYPQTPWDSALQPHSSVIFHWLLGLYNQHLFENWRHHQNYNKPARKKPFSTSWDAGDGGPVVATTIQPSADQHHDIFTNPTAQAPQWVGQPSDHLTFAGELT